MEPSYATDPVAALRAALERVAGDLDGGDIASRLTLERPPKADLGDYSTNAAMLLAPTVGASPREVAERLSGALTDELGSTADRIEVAGPGFLNLFLSDRWHREATAGLLAAGDRLGVTTPESPERVLVEFVSANPTGPVTAASARGAAYGDSLARLLERSGHAVDREYYLNDAGTQVRLFAESVAARMRDEEPPDGGYTGDYVRELAASLREQGADPSDLDELAKLATEAMRRRIQETLAKFGVRFDVWSSERQLRESGSVEETLAELRERGHVYDSEGAVWLRTSSFGDDKDRVLIRKDGEPTYFGPDIAYHRDKIRRGYDHLINVLGADHHGYVPRMRAALAALGVDPDRFEAPIMQMVSIVEGGERARMSKRKGDFVTLDELIADIGADATRFFMLQRSHDTTIDIDLELARKASQDNPVYYVQYAHARIASILRKATADGVAVDPEATSMADGALDAPCEPAERTLVRRLLELPAEVRLAAERRAPHRLCAYGAATAADFHAFYRDCRVVGAEPDVEAARLALCVVAKRTIATTLGLAGVSVPERM
ncbi:MAG TPA: arginine--tRNA ligase [Solirubrobacterales bacterium]|nr:arginine--tRNA ligase [Solirubrobacterales bacterium]